MERDMIRALQFDFVYVSPVVYIERYLKVLDLQQIKNEVMVLSEDLL